LRFADGLRGLLEDLAEYVRFGEALRPDVQLILSGKRRPGDADRRDANGMREENAQVHEGNGGPEGASTLARLSLYKKARGPRIHGRVPKGKGATLTPAGPAGTACRRSHHVPHRHRNRDSGGTLWRDVRRDRPVPPIEPPRRPGVGRRRVRTHSPDRRP